MFTSLINSDRFHTFLSFLTTPYRHRIAELQAHREYALTNQFKESELLKQIITTLSTYPTQFDKNLASIEVIKKFFTQEQISTPTSHLETDTEKAIAKLITDLIPWRKGPYNFEVSNSFIDSEWDSSIKWNILSDSIKSAIRKTVADLRTTSMNPLFIADLGCNNGYFMHRIKYELSREIKSRAFIVGYEPILRNALQFVFLHGLLAKHINQNTLSLEEIFLLLGYEHLSLFPHTYDLILALGVLYHYSDPVGLLVQMREALKPSGTIIIDCQGIPGEDSIALFPGTYYTNKRGFWFLPTLSALKGWIIKAGFIAKNIEVLHSAPLRSDEQRATPLAPGDSLREGLIRADNYYAGNVMDSSTNENYPPPIRFYLKVTKP